VIIDILHIVDFRLCDTDFLGIALKLPAAEDWQIRALLMQKMFLRSFKTFRPRLPDVLKLKHDQVVQVLTLPRCC
jgi:hypothetical protein